MFFSHSMINLSLDVYAVLSMIQILVLAESEISILPT